jgi:membrane protease subunit HflC
MRTDAVFQRFNRMKRILLVAAVLIVWLLSCPFTVDQAEYAYVTQFGRPVAILDGATSAGLHFKWPWPVQSVQRLDRRVQLFDLPPAELLTHDPQGRTIDRTLDVEAYVVWRIDGSAGVDRFLRTVGTPEQARAILGQRVAGRLGAAVGTMPLEELVSVADPAGVAARSERLRDRLLGPAGGDGDLRDLARDAYGIEVVDVRVRRFNYPAAVRPEIARRIVSERLRKAAEYQGEGVRRSAEITSAAARDAAILESDAKAAAQRVLDRATIEADRLRNDAQSLDPEFYAFLQKIKTYQRILSDTRDVLLLSAKHELFDLLLKPPKPSGMNGSPSPSPGIPARTTSTAGGP